MTANAWVFTDVAKQDILNGVQQVGPDTYKCALFLSTSNIGTGSTTFAGVTNEHAAANGYTAGGISVDLTVGTGGTPKIDIATDPVWTASGGSIVARFAVVYEVGGNVLCYSLLDNTPANVTATDGNTLTVAAHATNGVASLSSA